LKVLTLKEKIENNKKFFYKTNEDGIVAGFSIFPEFHYKGYKHANNLLGKADIKPDDIDIDGIMKDEVEYLKKNDNICGSAIQSISPLCTLPWHDVIIGGRLEVSKNSYAPSTYATDITKETARTGKIFLDKRWLDKLLEYIKKAVDFSKGRYPISAPNLRGPSDLLQLMWDDGYLNMIYRMNDEPDKVKSLLNNITDFYIDMRDRTFKLFPFLQGGMPVINFNIWAPDRTFFLQEDAGGAILSPKLYREFIYPMDCRIIDNFPNLIFHMHSDQGYKNMIDAILENKKLNLVNIMLDPSGPTVGKMLPVFQRVLRAGKSLYIYTIHRKTIPPDEFEYVIKNLPDKGKGVFFHMKVESIQEAEDTMKFIEDCYN